MKALTLHQPWASLLAHGLKRCETRSWQTAHRGPLLVHASRKWDDAADDLCRSEPFRTALVAAGLLTTAPVPPDELGPLAEFVTSATSERLTLPLGAILGVVEVVACYPSAQVFYGHNLGRDVPKVSPGRLEISERESRFGDYSSGRRVWLTTNPRPLAEPVRCRGYQQLWEPTPDVLAQIRRQLA